MPIIMETAGGGEEEEWIDVELGLILYMSLGLFMISSFRNLCYVVIIGILIILFYFIVLSVFVLFLYYIWISIVSLLLSLFFVRVRTSWSDMFFLILCVPLGVV